MCGFGGVVNSTTGIDSAELSKIARIVSHRGPDSTGLALFDEVFNRQEYSSRHAFFFNRLAIIDLDPRANQPFEDEQYMLLFNGEIYNYLSIKEELSRTGVKFRTTSDTEVLFFALRSWGKEALRKLNGMFAFFWLSKRDQTFLLARDRTGIKPVYYKMEGESFIFASELDTVVRLCSNESKVSPVSMQDFLYFQYVPTPNTILEDIYKLEPGHYLESSIANLKNHHPQRSSAYWDGYHEMVTSANRNFDSALEQALVESVRDQLIADVPLGLFLSSGVDSSLLTALINKYFSGRSFDFFTVAFERETESDESLQAKKYLEGFRNPNLLHHVLRIDPSFISSRLEKMYDFYDEPFGDHASLLNMAISEKAREHVTVVLSGDGADELFWGYPRYNQWLARTRSPMTHGSFPKAAKKILGLLPDTWMTSTAMNLVEQDPVNSYLNLISPRMFRSLRPRVSEDRLWFCRGLSELKSRNDLPSVIDIKTYLPDAMLYKVDRSSMASSLEVRVPYLDNRVLDISLEMPQSVKSSLEFRNKSPLKKLLTRLAPNYDIASRKRGFNFPLELWLKKEWKEMVLDHITRSSLSDVGLENPMFIRLVEQFYQGKNKYAVEVWHLLNLVLWHEAFKKKISDSSWRRNT